MMFLVVGLDRMTLAPWHRNIRECDAAGAERTARARAGADHVDLMIAAVIGPNSTVLDGHPVRTAPLLRAA